MPKAVTKIPDALRRALPLVRTVAGVTGASLSPASSAHPWATGGPACARTVESLRRSVFSEDPQRTWAAVMSLAQKATRAEPDAAHRALVAIEQAADRFILLTRTIDGLHTTAGTENLVEIHGNLRQATCMKCEGRVEIERLGPRPVAPSCSLCGGMLRPDLVLVDEALPVPKLLRLRQAFYREAPDLIIVAGASAALPYITEPLDLARQLGNLTVEINFRPTPLSRHVEYSLRGPVGEVLEDLAETYRGLHEH